MIFASDSSILVVFCRRPTLGTGKQRIAAELGQQAALELSELLLATTLEDARAWPDPVVIAPASIEDSDWARDLVPAAHVIPQVDGNLGERLATVDHRIRGAGGRQLLYIGSDAPALKSAQLRAAAAALTNADCVFIPARDGGVTLMGAARPWPELADLPWGTAELGRALKRRCEEAGFTMAALAESFDIDTPRDLADAPRLLRNDARPARVKLLKWIADTEPADQPEISISVVIPVYRDLAALENLLDTLHAMPAPVDEIIVVDGEENDTCRTLCEQHAARYLAAGPCRGEQLRLGADCACGDITWFLHADSAPPADAPELIRQHIEAGYAGGYFQFRFQGGRRWYKQLLERAINLRASAGIPYGDQGLFCRRDAYQAAGGFAATPLFEEVGFVRGLRQQGRFAPVNASIGVSPRRWERDGWLRRSIHNRWLAIAFMLGVAPERLVRRYDATRDTGGG
ncbi:MAG: TIGR04283 family arsenosugar biosynthesis glycosyltransferase [Gammaproteobacteria bacterium]|jgi:rSAM/selenodomain-associated transferase 2/rSAM/selenodomain-associated transferase 1|nr:TIGR04283 family arsenosugar biosynthesis glycosyltransferase [Gammaproteobacteria bacterium]MDP6616406.1 TIGR04283 family arsenosugar biosynthesis glycosyltransferase [Gammaproteobacteria bacterium]MDP6695736.1 TIGR04283 family arsenosugar biosynthesis glycosyltransferase [Gammaproteobacteria bacterium]